MKVKLLGISAGRPEGNTDYLLQEALKAAEDLHIAEAEIINISEKKIEGCIACHQCFGHEKGWGLRDGFCYAHKDDLQSVAERLLEADGIIIGSPVYVFGVPSKLRAFFERTAAFTATAMNEASGSLCYKSLGILVVAAGRRAGQDQTAAEIMNWGLCMGLNIVPAFPTNDGLPAASMHIASADCLEAKAYLSKDATRLENSRMPYPLGAISALKSAQNAGRNVAVQAAVIGRKGGNDIQSHAETP
ncbi:flavodoxin family protein, partial [Thermodesulfobacteriota bacterium]